MHRDPHKADLGDDILPIDLESRVLAFECVVCSSRVEGKMSRKVVHVCVECSVDRQQVLIRLVVMRVGLRKVSVAMSRRSSFQAQLLEQGRDALEDANRRRLRGELQ
jgi:hypothetical protein